MPGRGPATPHRSPRPAPLTYGRALADADNWYAASRLADLLFERGDFDGLGARIGVGDDAAFSRLTALLIMHGQGEEAERLRRFGLNPDGSVACA